MNIHNQICHDLSTINHHHLEVARILAKASPSHRANRNIYLLDCVGNLGITETLEHLLKTKFGGATVEELEQTQFCDLIGDIGEIVRTMNQPNSTVQ